MSIDLESKITWITHWAGLIAAVLGLLATLVGAWFYLENIRNDMQSLSDQIIQLGTTESIRDAGWLKEDEANHMESQESIRELRIGLEENLNELIKQSVILNDIVTAMATSFTQREQRFEELENEHKLILQAIADSQYKLGIHQGTHDSLKELIEDYLGCARTNSSNSSNNNN